VPLDSDEGDSNEAPHENLVAHFDPLGDLTRGEMVEKLRQAVLALPAHYREALVLCELHELSYADAAGSLNCAVGTVRSRLHRARAMLAEKMRGREREGARESGGEAESGAEGGDARAGVLQAARCFA
jgi:RNA polymerase sigma-70 factor (ECF subfamily)